MDVKCQNGGYLPPSTIQSNSNTSTGVLIGALILVMAIFLCLLINYCRYKRAQIKTIPDAVEEDKANMETKAADDEAPSPRREAGKIAFDKVTMDS